MDIEFIDRLTNVLCPIHHKKIQFMCMADNTHHFFVCPDCMTKEKKFVVENIDFLVSIDDFKHNFLKKMQGEMGIMNETVERHLAHMNNHLKDSALNIEEDFIKLEKVINGYVKIMLRSYKNKLVNKFNESNKENKRALESLRKQISLMTSDFDGNMNQLQSVLTNKIENAPAIQAIMQGFLAQRRDYSQALERMNLLSTSFTFQDLISEYRLSNAEFHNLTKKLKDRINFIFYNQLGTDEFKNEVIVKPLRKIQEVNLKSTEIFELGDFEKFTHPKLKTIGAFETSKHSSHHVLSSCMVENAYIVTGHSDSTFKFWMLNPDFFDTPFKSNRNKPLRPTDFKRKGKKIHRPFQLGFVSPTDKFHKYYVTSLCFYERETDKAKILISGDAGGDLIASEIQFNKTNGKIEKVEPFFRKRAHDGWITNIKRYKNLDIIITSSHDNSITFWEVEKKRKLMNLTEHEQPIQSIQFCHGYEYMVSATQEDLVIWKLSCEEGADYDEVPEGDDEEDLPSKYSITATVVTSEYFEEKTTRYNTTKLFSSNYRNDFLLFISINSDIKIMNIRDGEYVGDIDGAHFKGTSNYGLMVNSSMSSRLKETFMNIERAIKNAEMAKRDTLGEDEEVDVDLLELFVEQLNEFMLITCSSKDKIKIWKFEEGISTHLTQENCLGGNLDNLIFVLKSKTKDVIIATAGSCSNKIELYNMVPTVKDY